MKTLRLLLCLLFLSGFAAATQGTWTLYYSDTGCSVDGNGSCTLTPTVSLTGNDGGWCPNDGRTYGYETPAVLLNGNAWAIMGAPVYDSGGTEDVDWEYTFPNVTLPPGTSADLSFAGKVQGECFRSSDEGGIADESYGTFWLQTFYDGYGPQVSPAPCWIQGFTNTPHCPVPWPVLFNPFNVHHCCPVKS